MLFNCIFKLQSFFIFCILKLFLCMCLCVCVLYSSYYFNYCYYCYGYIFYINIWCYSYYNIISLFSYAKNWLRTESLLLFKFFYFHHSKGAQNLVLLSLYLSFLFVFSVQDLISYIFKNISAQFRCYIFGLNFSISLISLKLFLYILRACFCFRWWCCCCFFVFFFVHFDEITLHKVFHYFVHFV